MMISTTPLAVSTTAHITALRFSSSRCLSRCTISSRKPASTSSKRVRISSITVRPWSSSARKRAV